MTNTKPGVIATPLPAGAWSMPRPVDESYWVVPGRLLVGAHPGSRSRAQAMDRLRRFLEAGITCFVDLTEPSETAPYEHLLPFETPTGRRIEYLREPIVDHGVPASRDTMDRILVMLDGALATGHVVYLHCRAGIGRSALAAGCWLAERSGSGEQALRELGDLWQQAAQSRHYPVVPETPDQADFVRHWRGSAAETSVAAVATASTTPAMLEITQRMRGAWLGLAVGDALGHARAQGLDDTAGPLAWTQHTALALCLAESLLATGRSDARDQMERYVRWLKQGEGAASPGPQDGAATPDVAKAIATYLWRGLPMAGPHDPRDLASTSLPRALAAASSAWADPVLAVARSAECARTTHQSPTILDACRLYAATLVSALQGQPPPAWLARLPEPVPQLWSKPLRKEVRAIVAAAPAGGLDEPGRGTDVLHVLAEVRRIALTAQDFEGAIIAACRAGRDDAALYGALVGTLAGLRFGETAIPRGRVSSLAQGGAPVLDVADRCMARQGAPAGPA